MSTAARAVALLCLAALTAACSGSGDDEASPTTTTTVTTASSGGTAAGGADEVRLGVPEEPASLNPFDGRSRTQAGLAVLGVVLPQLFRVAPTGKVEGWLADDATVAEDGDGASFSLRSGARWSDGTPISVDDVRFTLEAVRSGRLPAPKAGYDRVTAVEGGGAEVRLTFDGPFPGWRRLFSGPDFLLPAHRLAGRDGLAEWGAGPDVAGGPFRLGTVTPGLEVVLERNDSWWGGAAGLSRLRVTVVPDSRTLEQLLDRGELEVAWPPAEPNRQRRYRRLKDVDVDVAGPGGRLEMLVANGGKLDEPRRAALLGLVPRDRFVDVLLTGGEAQRAASLAGPANPASAAVPVWRDDVAAGAPPLAKGSTATLVGEEEDPVAPLVARVVEAAAYDRAATVELKFSDSRRVEGRWLRDGEYDLALVDDVAWPQPCWRCWFGGHGAGDAGLARTPGLGDLAAAAERGDAGAVEALEQAVRARSAVLPLWRPATVLAGRGVSGLEANSWSPGPFWRVERWRSGGRK